ncbi:MAG: MAPEG family protein [Myxococcota bacterium]
MSSVNMSGPIAVSLAYVVLYYVLQGMQLRVKSRLEREYRERGEKFDRYFNQDREMLAADRVVLNTVEHMGPFLLLLWLMAVFVDPFRATVGGTVYVLGRATYPFVLGRRLGRNIPLRIVSSTFPGYGVLIWFIVELLVVL